MNEFCGYTFIRAISVPNFIILYLKDISGEFNFLLIIYHIKIAFIIINFAYFLNSETLFFKFIYINSN